MSFEATHEVKRPRSAPERVRKVESGEAFLGPRAEDPGTHMRVRTHANTARMNHLPTASAEPRERLMDWLKRGLA